MPIVLAEGAWAMSKEAIHQALSALHAAQEAHDLDAMVAVYADQGFVDKQSMRAYFKALIDQDVLKNRLIDLSHSETFIFRDNALVRPVVYATSQGKRSFFFQFARQEDGSWRIIDNGRSYVRIGDSTVPRRSCHLDLWQQVPESDSTCPRDRSREWRRGDSEETQARYFAKNRHVGRRVDQVTGIGSPTHRLVKLEVRLGLGDWIGRREQLGFTLPGRRPTRGGL